MRGFSGFDVCTHMKHSVALCKIVFLTDLYSDEAIIWSRHVLADGFICKRADIQEIVRVIRAVHTRTYVWPRTSLDTQLTDDVRRALTPSEKCVFEYILAGYTIPEIARKLNRSIRTIANQRRALLFKLGVHHSIALSKYAFIVAA